MPFSVTAGCEGARPLTATVSPTESFAGEQPIAMPPSANARLRLIGDRRFIFVNKLPDRPNASPGTVSIARALSKLGYCSRAEGERLVTAGRVRVNGAVVREISKRVSPENDQIEVDGTPVGAAAKVYLALNKPRGLVTTRDDPEGRATIYECLNDTLTFVGPVGRLDKASEGLLLLTNDTQWANGLTDPASHVDKTYHVQVKGDGLATVLERVTDIKRIALLRSGSRSTAWFEIVIDEGKNRQLRRIFEALDLEVTRLVRVAIGPLVLGALAKGEWRHLTAREVKALRRKADPSLRSG
jgi:23S rRNA pseudouridine2605 synthase